MSRVERIERGQLETQCNKLSTIYDSEVPRGKEKVFLMTINLLVSQKALACFRFAVHCGKPEISV
jgi:hypothetical protein